MAAIINIDFNDLPSKEELIRQIALTGEYIWDRELLKGDIDDWLSNFKGEVYIKEYEQILALWLLCNFVYYNRNEVRHLCRTLYKDFIHKLFLEKEEMVDIDDTHSEIIEQSRFFPLGAASESSAYILYYFRQENHLPIKRFVTKLDEIGDNVKNIIFVDDVSLSYGDYESGESKNQAYKYIKKIIEGNEKMLKCRKILLTFISTKGAIEYLNKKDIEVISPIILDDMNRCFFPDSFVFEQYGKHRLNAQTFAEHYGLKVKPNHPLGHNNGQFMFGFYYNTPDNTLPIFWSKENDWKPILKRYHKNYRNKLNKLGTYI